MEAPSADSAHNNSSAATLPLSTRISPPLFTVRNTPSPHSVQPLNPHGSDAPSAAAMPTVKPTGLSNIDIVISTKHVYVAKLLEELPQKVMTYLQHFVDTRLRVAEDTPFDFYPDENDEQGKNVLLLAKGLLRRLTQRGNNRNEFVPNTAKVWNSKGNQCEFKFPTQHQLYPLAAIIVVPLFDKNEDTNTINLSLRTNGSNRPEVTARFKNGGAYIVRCKNHNKKTNCKSNTVDCALHCNKHTLNIDSSSKSFRVLVFSYCLADYINLNPPPLENVDEKKFILYKNMKFNHEDNEGDGLCLFYSVSTHLQYETNGGSSSIPDDWVAFRDKKNKKDGK